MQITSKATTPAPIPLTPAARANGRLVRDLIEAEPVLASVARIELLMALPVLRRRLRALHSLKNIQL
jgi:hypothetical protein